MKFILIPNSKRMETCLASTKMGTIKLLSTPIIYTPHCQADDKRLLAAKKYLYNLHLIGNEYD
jgi:hypothetical protein